MYSQKVALLIQIVNLLKHFSVIGLYKFTFTLITVKSNKNSVLQFKQLVFALNCTASGYSTV